MTPHRSYLLECTPETFKPRRSRGARLDMAPAPARDAARCRRHILSWRVLIALPVRLWLATVATTVLLLVSMGVAMRKGAA